MHPGKERAIRYLIDLGDLSLIDGAELTAAIINPEEKTMDQTPKPPTDDSSVFFIGTAGLVNMAVCAPATMTHEQIATEVNIKNPTGLAGGWAVVADKADLPDADDVPVYPVKCPDTDDRLHYMVHC